MKEKCASWVKRSLYTVTNDHRDTETRVVSISIVNCGAAGGDKCKVLKSSRWDILFDTVLLTKGWSPAECVDG